MVLTMDHCYNHKVEILFSLLHISCSPDRWGRRLVKGRVERVDIIILGANPKGAGSMVEWLSWYFFWYKIPSPGKQLWSYGRLQRP